MYVFVTYAFSKVGRKFAGRKEVLLACDVVSCTEWDGHMHCRLVL